MDVYSSLEYLALNPINITNIISDTFEAELKEAYDNSDSLAVRELLSKEKSSSFADMSHCVPFPDMSHGLSIKK